MKTGGGSPGPGVFVFSSFLLPAQGAQARLPPPPGPGMPPPLCNPRRAGGGGAAALAVAALSTSDNLYYVNLRLCTLVNLIISLVLWPIPASGLRVYAQAAQAWVARRGRARYAKM